MPDKDGKLTKAENDKIIAWLNEKGKNHACPFCAQNTWGIPDYLHSGSAYHGPGRVGGMSYPQVMVACNNCSYIRTFMAIPILGMEAFEPPKKEEATEKKSEEGGQDAA